MKKLLLLLMLVGILPMSVFSQTNFQVSTISTSGVDCSVATNCASLKLNPNMGGGSITINGVFTGTLQFEGSPDGSTWLNIVGTPFGGGSVATSTTATGIWTISVVGLANVRVRASSLTGSASVTFLITLAAPAAIPTQISSTPVNANGIGSLLQLQNTNASLGANSYSDDIVWWAAPEGSGGQDGTGGTGPLKNGWHFYRYGDGSAGIRQLNNGFGIVGLHLDVGNSFNGKTYLWTQLGQVGVGTYGDKCFGGTVSSNGNVSSSTLQIADSCGNLANNVSPNPGEVGYDVTGKLTVYRGLMLPSQGAGNGQPVMVASGDGHSSAGNIAATTIYNTSGALTISAASRASNLETITTVQNIPSAWFTNMVLDIIGLTGDTTQNCSACAVTITGANTFTYASTGSNGSATVSQGVVKPTYGALGEVNVYVGTAAITSIVFSSGTTFQANIAGNGGANGIDSQFVAGKVIHIQNVTGNTSLNGYFVVTVSSGIGGSGVQFTCASCPASNGTVVATTQIGSPQYYGGAGLYHMVVNAVAENAGAASNVLTITATYTDESGNASATQTATGNFVSQGQTVTGNFYFEAASASQIKITLNGSTGNPGIYSYKYRVYAE